MSNTVKDKKLYDLLGVKPDADDTTIKKAYRKMALKWHPDKWANATEKEKKLAEEKIKEYNEAQEILTDPQKRKIYDSYGLEAAKGNEDGHHHMDEEMMQKIFEEMGGGFPFPGMGGRQNGREKEVSMANINAEVKLTFKQAYTGATVDLEVTRYILKKNKQPKKQDLICADCKGRGVCIRLVQMGPGMMTQSQQKCEKCNGGILFPDEFFEKKLQKFQQVIKKGIANGEQIVANDMGHSVPDCFKDQFPGQKHSNLIVHVFSESHCDINGTVYVRGVNGHPANLRVDITIEPYEALCGTYKNIPYVDDTNILINIPAGLIFKRTNGGSGKHIIVVPSKGMPFYKQKNAFGELFVEVAIAEGRSLDKSKLEEIWKIYTGNDMNEWISEKTKNRTNDIVNGMFIEKYAESEHYKKFQQKEKESNKQSNKNRHGGRSEYADDSDDNDDHRHPGGCAQQ